MLTEFKHTTKEVMMKKILGLMIIMGCFLFVAGQSFANCDLANGSGGAAVECATDNVAGVSTFNFSPSPAVITDGDSFQNKFVIGAVHEQALDNTGGKEYGMAYDSTKVYWFDVSGTDTMEAVTGSDSSIFSSWNH
jgi:hypothetical protein